MKGFARFLPVLASLFLLPFFAQGVLADTLDFGCTGVANCNGSITDVFSGGVLLSATDLNGITVVNGGGPADDQGLNFTFAFDTTLPSSPFNIILIEQGGDGSALLGSILSFNGTQNVGGSGFDIINLNVLWTNMSPDFATFLGAPSGLGPVFASIVIDKNGAANSVDIGINPTPEPGSLLLLGSGLLGVGGFLRRRIFGA